MNHFVTLFLQLDQTNKTNDKVNALENFLRQASPSDRLWMIALFTGRHPKRAINSRLLTEWVMDQSGLPDWLFEETYHVIGDLAETLALLWPNQTSSRPGSLSEWMLTWQELHYQSLPERRQTITRIWNQLNATERLVFNKVFIGGLRLGVSQNLLIRALANVMQVDSNVMAHRLMGNWDPSLADPDFLMHTTEEQASSTRPYPFCLAYPLDMSVEELGPSTDWSVEWKWDGIRAQIVHREEFFTIWSRGEEVVNDRFPELVQLQAIIPPGTVLDGEILACIGDKILPFNLLQQRIGRKKITPAILKEVPVIFLAYDLLEWEGQDWRQRPFIERRAQLEAMIKLFASHDFLRLSPRLPVKDWVEVHQIRSESRAHEAEGVMLKKFDSPYHTGRKRGDWWKWKIESYTIDGVLLYAEKGHGWRANVYSDYTFAVWDKGQLIPFAKAYSGLTKQELKEVDRFIKTHTIEKFGPVRSVKPELVFEIAFEGILTSKRHKSGIAVRFPRIQRWRHDKKPEDADTLETLRALLKTPE